MFDSDFGQRVNRERIESHDYSSRPCSEHSVRSRSSIFGEKDIKKKMVKLADMEKKFKEKKFYNEDPNRDFVMKNSHSFL